MQAIASIIRLCAWHLIRGSVGVDGLDRLMVEVIAIRGGGRGAIDTFTCSIDDLAAISNGQTVLLSQDLVGAQIIEVVRVHDVCTHIEMVCKVVAEAVPFVIDFP